MFCIVEVLQPIQGSQTSDSVAAAPNQPHLSILRPQPSLLNQKPHTWGPTVGILASTLSDSNFRVKIKDHKLGAK